MDQIIVLVGPTGVGKTALSIQLAKALNGEIISGDAYQVYKQLSIGSAKITHTQMQGITHYLVDDRDYKEDYNVKIFQEEGRALINTIKAKGKVPIICGGTGLYIKALLYDYMFEQEQVDDTYLNELKKQSREELYALLQEVDPQASESIHQNNTQRVMRALVMAKVGSKKSERLKQQEHKMLYDAYVIGLTLPREMLYENINARVHTMMDEGLLAEINDIVENNDTFNLQSMRGIGYKEWQPYFNQEASVEDTIALIQKNSRNFAKRQMTWFNNQMQVHWYDKNDSNQAIVDAQLFLSK